MKNQIVDYQSVFLQLKIYYLSRLSLQNEKVFHAGESHLKSSPLQRHKLPYHVAVSLLEAVLLQ